jgi:outer membrane protein OmpA-like peptidoglycan-associated protein
MNRKVPSYRAKSRNSAIRFAGTRSRHHKRWSAVVVVVLAVAGFVLAGILIPPSVSTPPEVAAVVVYTAPDAQQTAYSPPADFVTAITTIANDHNSILLVRVEGDGSTSTVTRDLTPRTSGGEVLNVPDRIQQAIDIHLEALINEMNRSTPGTTSRGLYAGLLQARIPHGVPVWIFSSGLDLCDPDDARDLAWTVPVADLVNTLNDARAVPDLAGAEVKFVMTAPAGGQEMRSTQTQYLHEMWSGLLMNASASSVLFINMPPGQSASQEQVAIVPLPTLPDTPIAPQPTADGGVTCTLSDVFFVFGSDMFVDENKTRANLQDCVTAMRSAPALTVMGTVSYEGGFDSLGNPLDSDYGKPLAQARANKVATMLADDFGIPRSIMTIQGFGGTSHLPYPQDPKSPQNRAVVISTTAV